MLMVVKFQVQMATPTSMLATTLTHLDTVAAIVSFSKDVLARVQAARERIVKVTVLPTMYVLCRSLSHACPSIVSQPPCSHDCV